MVNPREQLSDLLKQSRVDAGYTTQGALARKIKVSRPVISKAENPAQPIPSEPLMTAWSGATGVPLNKLTDLAERARSGTPDWLVPYVAAETAATMLRFWGPLLVPGLVQTEAYAREVLGIEGNTGDRLHELLTARMERRSAIGRARVTVAVDHTVLERCIGSPELMAEQCGHLAALAEEQKVRVHVVPKGANIGLYGAFAIASHDGDTTVNLTSIRDIASVESGLVEECVRSFEDILAAALPRVQSVEFIQACEETGKGQA